MKRPKNIIYVYEMRIYSFCCKNNGVPTPKINICKFPKGCLGFQPANTFVNFVKLTKGLKLKTHLQMSILSVALCLDKFRGVNFIQYECL
jgi:hypothetical protein